VYKFCIDGDCDAGAYGEHRLRLDGNWFYNGYWDFREGQCHSIVVPSQFVEAWSSLTVGTEEEDSTSQNDSWFADMPSSQWYNPTCETYEIRLSKQFEAEKAKSVCWDISVEAEAKGVTVGAGATSCTSWTQPAESFMWTAKRKRTKRDEEEGNDEATDVLKGTFLPTTSSTCLIVAGNQSQPISVVSKNNTNVNALFSLVVCLPGAETRRTLA
jgi:hypothetical protein